MINTSSIYSIFLPFFPLSYVNIYFSRKRICQYLIYYSWRTTNINWKVDNMSTCLRLTFRKIPKKTCLIWRRNHKVIWPILKWPTVLVILVHVFMISHWIVYFSLRYVTQRTFWPTSESLTSLKTYKAKRSYWFDIEFPGSNINLN